MASPFPPREKISKMLFDAWTRGTSIEGARRVATEIPVPGTIALRGRFHVLVDGGGSPFPPGTFDIEWDTWTRQIELTEAANEALVRNDLTTARERLQDLISTHTEGRHPLPVIEAYIGWADAARQADQFDTAAQHLDAAFAVAAAARCRFGTARAQLASGYLALQCGSARDALRWFSSA